MQLLYVAPAARGGPAAVRLLRALRAWARQNQAHDLHVNVTTAIQPARTDKFLRKMGFRQTGGNYVLGGSGGMSGMRNWTLTPFLLLPFSHEAYCPPFLDRNRSNEILVCAGSG